MPTETVFLTTAATYCKECSCQIWWTWDEDSKQIGVHPTNSCSHSAKVFDPPELTAVEHA